MQNSLLIKNNKLLYLISPKAPRRWTVKVTDEAFATLTSGELDEDDLRVIHEWTKFVVMRGPEALQLQKDTWDDHELYDEWIGYRASRFSYSGRIIYRVEEKIVTVIVVRVTRDHDYRKRD